MHIHIRTHTQTYISIKSFQKKLQLFWVHRACSQSSYSSCLKSCPLLGRINGTTAVSSPLCKEAESFWELSFPPTFIPTMWQLFFWEHPNLLPEDKQNFQKQLIKRKYNQWVYVWAGEKGGGKKVKGHQEHTCLFRCLFPRNFAKFSMSSEPFLFSVFVCFGFFLYQKFFKASLLLVFLTFHIVFAFLRKPAAEMLF